jgi:hypothetical protein
MEGSLILGERADANRALMHACLHVVRKLRISSPYGALTPLGPLLCRRSTKIEPGSILHDWATLSEAKLSPSRLRVDR